MLRLRAAALAACLAFASTGTLACPAFADHNRAEIDSDAANALQALYKDNPAARAISQKARAILVFPRITKAGFVFGAG